MSSRFYKGFSLLEVLVTMGILLLATIIVFPVTLQKTQESKLNSRASEIANDIYFQQQRADKNGIEGGVAISSNSYTLYDGESLATASETVYKEFPANIYITSVSLVSGNEIHFESGEFKSLNYGSFVLTDGVSMVHVEINSEGLIDYELL